MELSCPACKKTARLSGSGRKEEPIEGCLVFECDQCQQDIVVSVLGALSDKGTWSLAARKVSVGLLRQALHEALVSVLPDLPDLGIRQVAEPETVTLRKDAFDWLLSEAVARKKAEPLNPPDLSYDRVPFDQISEQGAGNYYVFKVPYNKSVPIVYVPREGLDAIYGQGRMSRNSTIDVTISLDGSGRLDHQSPLQPTTRR